MPKTPVNKQDCFISWEQQIRFSRKSWVMESKSEALSMKKRANPDFWFRVLLLYRSHYTTAIFPAYVVQNQPSQYRRD